MTYQKGDNITELGTLTSLSVNGGIKKSAIETFTGADTLDANNHIAVCNSAGAFTLNLPAATGSGREFIIHNVNSGVVTIDANGAETINGSLTHDLTQNNSVTLYDYASGKWFLN